MPDNWAHEMSLKEYHKRLRSLGYSISRPKFPAPYRFVYTGPTEQANDKALLASFRAEARAVKKLQDQIARSSR